MTDDQPATGTKMNLRERFQAEQAAKPLDVQVGGSHYKNMAIQPVEFIHANGIGYIEGCVIKYICRYENKNGIEDLKKIKHYVDLLIELEQTEANDT
jgi:hypothetical protein